jgi:hypothetical protein
VQTALRSPKPAQPRSLLGRFFGVAVDSRAYAALFYMLLSLATGIFYFTWVTTGLSLSAGLLVLIVGIPFIILYFASVRVLSLVEGRMIEVMLGERMPRRPLYVDRGKPWLTRIKELFTDGRSWTTQLYFLLMLPLGVVYFTLAVTLLSTAAGLIAAPFLVWFGDAATNSDINGIGWLCMDTYNDIFGTSMHYWLLPLVLAVGVLLLFATLHLARGIGYLHAQLAKHLLVKIAPRV